MKARPTNIYRVEQRCNTCSYHNSTTQYLNKPEDWKGPHVTENERMLGSQVHLVTVTVLEGTIIWEEELRNEA